MTAISIQHQTQAEIIDIDYLWYMIEEESHEDHQDGDIIVFCHSRRGWLTALQSGNTALIVPGKVRDNRGLPATAEVVTLKARLA